MTQGRTAYRVDYPGELLRQCQLAGVPEPVREYRFHPTRRWRFDLAWSDFKLGVECDGATFTNGRHTRGAGYAKDCEKLNEATLLGWRVLRFTSRQVIDGTALRYICFALGYGYLIIASGDKTDIVRTNPHEMQY